MGFPCFQMLSRDDSIVGSGSQIPYPPRILILPSKPVKWCHASRTQLHRMVLSQISFQYPARICSFGTHLLSNLSLSCFGCFFHTKPRSQTPRKTSVKCEFMLFVIKLSGTFCFSGCVTEMFSQLNAPRAEVALISRIRTPCLDKAVLLISSSFRAAPKHRHSQHEPGRYLQQKTSWISPIKSLVPGALLKVCTAKHTAYFCGRSESQSCVFLILNISLISSCCLIFKMCTLR